MNITLANTRLTEVFQNAKDRGTRSYNCWGATMYLLDGGELRWVEDGEMKRYIDSDRFEDIDKPTQVGDVLVIKDGKELIHTATYLDNGNYLHKKGSNVSELAKLEQIRDTYPQGQVSYKRHKPIKLTLLG